MSALLLAIKPTSRAHRWSSILLDWKREMKSKNSSSSRNPDRLWMLTLSGSSHLFLTTSTPFPELLASAAFSRFY
jgi:hypothetical protein